MDFDHKNIEKSIIINDRLKLYYLFLKIACFINIITISFNLYNSENKPANWRSYIWIILALISLILLICIFFKKDTSEKIETNEIVSLNKRNILGLKFYSLKLRNGKHRDLYNLKGESEILEIKKLFDQIIRPSKKS